MEDQIKFISEVYNNSFLTFKIKEEKFAVNAEMVSDILEVPSIIKIPGSPEILRGVIIFSKNAVPVADLRSILDYPKVGINVNSSIIIFRIIFDNRLIFIGALVDSIEEFIEVDTEQVKYLNYNREEIIVEAKNLKYKILNPLKIFTPEDYQLISNLISRASLNIK